MKAVDRGDLMDDAEVFPIVVLESDRSIVVGGEHTLDEVVAAHVICVLERLDGNRSEAAKELGIDRRSLQRMISRRFKSSRGLKKAAT